MIAVEIGIIDFAITIQVCVSALDRLARLWIVELMIYIKHVWLISLGEYLELVSIDRWTYLHIGLTSTLGKRKVLHLHVLPGEVVAQVPLPVLGLDRSCIQGNLDTLAIYITYVGKDSLWEVGTCCCRNRSQQILGLAGIEIDGTTDTTIQESKVETEVPGGSCLPLQVWNVCLRTISCNILSVDECLGTCYTGCIDRKIVVVADTFLLTGYTIAGTELQVRNNLVVLQPRLLCQGPSQSYRWEGTPTGILRETGRGIATDCSSQEIFSIEGVVDTTVVWQHHVTVIRSLHGRKGCTCRTLGIIKRCSTLPILVIVTSCQVHITLDILEILCIVGIESKQAVLVLLRTILVIATAQGLILVEWLCCIARNINGTITLGIICTNGSMELEVWQKMNLVIYIHRTDETAHLTLWIIKIHQTTWVSHTRIYWIAISIESLVIATIAVITWIYRNGWVECCSSPYCTTVIERVVIECTLGVDGQLQVILEEARSQHHVTCPALNIVLAHKTALVVISGRNTER